MFRIFSAAKEKISFYFVCIEKLYVCTFILYLIASYKIYNTQQLGTSTKLTKSSMSSIIQSKTMSFRLKLTISVTIVSNGYITNTVFPNNNINLKERVLTFVIFC